MQERGSPKQQRAKRTRDQLLAAARRAFAEAGYAGATIDDVARAAGCTKGAYYFHFASKEEALLALLDEWTRGRTEQLHAAMRAATPEAVLSDLLRALLTPEPPDRWEERLILEFWAQQERSPAVRRRLSRSHREWRSLIQDAIKQAQQAGAFPHHVRAEQIAEVALALHDGLAVQGRLGGARGRASAALALFSGDQSLRRTG